MNIENSIKLSVLLVTYNHEHYINRALGTVFAQTIEGPIEMVIADDKSSDRTLNIIREYEGKDSRFRFKYLESSSNLGITKNYQRGFAACTGKYIAVLEGDDYWTSPKKLQRQCEFLDEHWECDLCSVNYFIYEENLSRFTARTKIKNGYRLLDAREIIRDNLASNFSTCVYRKSALNNLPEEIYEIKSYDWIVNICIARYSLIGFLEKPMSIYRIHSSNVWSRNTIENKLKEMLEVIPLYDHITDGVFTSEFNELKNIIKRQLITFKFKIVLKPLKNFIAIISGYTPPIFLIIFKSLIPSKIKFLLFKIANRNKE